jgi:preprotein translocase subunit SecY
VLKTLRNAWRIEELRKKILFTLLIVLLYRLGNAVPVPYVNTTLLASVFRADAEHRPRTVQRHVRRRVLGSHDIRAVHTAVHQRLHHHPAAGHRHPALERLQKEEGEEGKKKLESITRYSTVAIGLLQGFAYYMLMKQLLLIHAPTANSVWAAIVIILTFTSGSAIIMWMGEQITEFGIGNGISIILFASIVARIPNSVVTTVRNVKSGDLHGTARCADAVGILGHHRSHRVSQ